MKAPLRPPDVMTEVQKHTLNTEIQDSTVCPFQPSTMSSFFQIKSTIEEVLGELTETVCVSNLTWRKSCVSSTAQRDRDKVFIESVMEWS